MSLTGLRDEDLLTLNDHLLEHLTALGLEPSQQLIDDAAARLSILDLLPLPLIALSNGQTRRARIVRALLANPEVLILEEPFSTLVASICKRVMAYLLHISRPGRR